MLKDNFKGKYAVVPTAWLNEVAAFINNICQGTGIKINRPNRPSPATPVVISVDEDFAKSGGAAGVPASVVTDVTWDSTNHKLVQTKKTLAVIRDDTSPTDSDILTFEAFDA